MLHHGTKDLMRIFGIYNIPSVCDLSQFQRCNPSVYLFCAFIERLTCMCKHQFVDSAMT